MSSNPVTVLSFYRNVRLKRYIAQGKRGLVILDGFRAHLHEEVKESIKECNFDLWVLPPNTTGHLQPLDLAVNRSFKFSYSLLWSLWMEKKKNVSEATVINGWKAVCGLP